MHGEHSKLTFGECGCRLESGNEYSIWHVHTKCGCRLEAGNVYSMWHLHTRTFGKILLSGLSNV